MSSICSEVTLLAGLLTTGCTLQECSTHPRPALPLPDEVINRYQLPGPVQEELLVPIGGQDGVEYFRGRLSCGDELAEFHFLRPTAARDENLPFLLCLPILAGGKALMWHIAGDFAARGYAVAWSRRISSAMKPGQRAADLETLFRRTVFHNRMLLDWARRQDGIDKDRTAMLGVSLGGIIGSAVLALEPELRAGVLVMAGADLPDIILHSAESRILKWRAWRDRTDGLSGAELLRELDRTLQSDPARLSAYVDTDKTFLVATTLDQVVPMRNQDLLWESLGRPRRLLLPLSHYSAALAIGGILSSAHEFMEERFSQPVEQASPAF